MATVGGSLSVRVTAMTSVPMRPAASRAVIVNVFTPGCSVAFGTLQAVVPDAAPLPPRSLVHDTLATPKASSAVPARLIVP